MMEQLMAWERVKVMERYISMNSLSELLDGYDVDDIACATGYYVYEDEPEPEYDDVDEFLDEADIDDVIEWLENKGYTVMED